MATLGDMLGAARDSAGRLEGWLEQADPDLAGEAIRAAGALGLGLAGYARMAVADFSRFADEDDWATLVSGIRDSADPATTCLAAMVHWRLAAQACDRHSHHGEGTADG